MERSESRNKVGARPDVMSQELDSRRGVVRCHASDTGTKSGKAMAGLDRLGSVT